MKTHPSGSKIEAMSLILPLSVGFFELNTELFESFASFVNIINADAMCPNPLPGLVLPLA